MDKICGHEKHKKTIIKIINSKSNPSHIFLYGPSGIGKTTFCKATLELFKQSNNVEIIYIDQAKPLHSQLLNYSLKYFNGIKIAIFNQIILSEQDIRTILLFCDMPDKLLFIFCLDNNYALPYQLIRKTTLCIFNPPEIEKCEEFFKNFPVNFYNRTQNIGKALLYKQFYNEDENISAVDTAIETFLNKNDISQLYDLIDTGHNITDVIHRIYMKIYEFEKYRPYTIQVLYSITLLKKKNNNLVARVLFHKLKQIKIENCTSNIINDVT